MHPYTKRSFVGSCLAGLIAFAFLLCISGGRNDAAEICAKLKNGLDYDSCLYALNR